MEPQLLERAPARRPFVAAASARLRVRAQRVSVAEEPVQSELQARRRPAASGQAEYEAPALRLEPRSWALPSHAEPLLSFRDIRGPEPQRRLRENSVPHCERLL